jgi:hypothetical protein
VHTLCRRRKSTAEPLGRSPGLEGRIAECRFAGRFTFPGCWAEWMFEATRLHSQWRDRAGFAPDFPVMPLVGTQGRQEY